MNRKTVITVIAALLLVGLLASCSSTAWVMNPYKSFDESRYICAVGKGATAEEADLAARKELSMLFGMAVQSTVSRTVIETSREKNGSHAGDSYSEFFSSNASVSVNADNLYGVQIAKRTVQKDGTCVSLAVMERKATSEYYLARLQADGEELEALKAAQPSKVGTLRGVADAVTMVRKANDYNTSVVMCNYISGSELPFRNIAEFYELYRRARLAVTLNVSVSGDDSGAVKSAVTKIFTDAGFAVYNGTVDPTAKVSVSIVWRETAGTGVASSFIFADYNADFSVVDLAANESILVESYKGKEGHQNYDSAQARAVNVLLGQIEESFRPAIEEAFTY